MVPPGFTYRRSTPVAFTDSDLSELHEVDIASARAKS
jgi:hypothetical protein